MAAIAARFAEAETEGCAAAQDYVFVTKRDGRRKDGTKTFGEPMSQSNLRRTHFEPILTKAQLGHLRIHDLRHASASLALTQGVAAKVVSERLGHSTTRLTTDRYSHLIGDLQTVAADQIEMAVTDRGSTRKNVSKSS